MLDVFEKIAKWYLIHKKMREIKRGKALLQNHQTNVRHVPLVPSEQMKGIYVRPDMEFVKLTSNEDIYNNPAMHLVPDFDFELLKTIRINLGKGVVTNVFPPEKLMQLEGNVDSNLANKMQFKNAEQLHKFYGFNEQEVLEITGCHLK